MLAGHPVGWLTGLLAGWLAAHAFRGIQRARSRQNCRHCGQLTNQSMRCSNVEEIEHKNVKFQVWDLGGQVGVIESERAAT
eukprot:SAG22_NODE_15_length_32914_cov_20.713546_8_plen_81_part_00